MALSSTTPAACGSTSPVPTPNARFSRRWPAGCWWPPPGSKCAASAPEKITKGVRECAYSRYKNRRFGPCCQQFGKDRALEAETGRKLSQHEMSGLESVRLPFPFSPYKLLTSPGQQNPREEACLLLPSFKNAPTTHSMITPNCS